jgi:hypothetical protein
MEMGTFQGVVKYRVVQKITWLGRRTATFIIHNRKTLTFECQTYNEKEKRSPVVVDRSLHSYEMFIAVKGPKPNTIVVKVL